MRRRMAIGGWVVMALLAVASAPVSAGAAGGSATAEEGPRAAPTVEIQVLSNRADLLSGGDALIRLVPVGGASLDGVQVTAGDRDVTAAFARRPNGYVEGLVSGLPEGATDLTARPSQGRPSRIALVNHPLQGPVLSGPQQRFFACQTEESGLGTSQLPACAAPVRHQYFARTQDGEFREIDDPSSPPPDTAQTTTQDGVTVPYVVRVESGVINRSIYRIAVLYGADEPWEPWAPQRRWAKRVVFTFGGGCGPGHNQGDNAPEDALDDFALGRGWMSVVSTLNVAGVNCNAAVTAETVMMIKEHLVETYGPPRHVIGWGGSGGAWNQNVIAEQYPGLLDGIVPEWGFVDFLSLIYNNQADCDLLTDYFAANPTLWLEATDQGAVAGKDGPGMCVAQGLIGPTQYEPDNTAPVQGTENTFGCDPSIPDTEIYNAASNPEGVRCTYQDGSINIFGRRPESSWTPPEQAIGRGFANRPFDNVGIQYGLAALEAGDITPAQFVDLNRKIGGLDIDAGHISQRSEADSLGLERAYRNSNLTSTQLGQQTTPSIDISIGDPAGDNTTTGHEQVFNEIKRARLQATGAAANQIVLRCALCRTATGTNTDIGRTALTAMDRWLTAIGDDTTEAGRKEKIARHRPSELADACWVTVDDRVSDNGRCDQLAPRHATPRMVAGEGLRHDQLKCALEPLDRSDYRVEFTDEQWDALREAFPSGVCDWSRPGVEQQDPLGAWLSYDRGPDFEGRPLGEPPRSTIVP